MDGAGQTEWRPESIVRRTVWSHVVQSNRQLWVDGGDPSLTLAGVP